MSSSKLHKHWSPIMWFLIFFNIEKQNKQKEILGISPKINLFAF